MELATDIRLEGLNAPLQKAIRESRNIIIDFYPPGLNESGLLAVTEMD
jgi:hypothetical protein